MKDLNLVVLSGPSGSGKSTAVKALEDLGFFCVDNMPVALWPKFMELMDQSDELTKAAVVVDVRERGFLKAFKPVFDELKAGEHHVVLLYLETPDEILVRRFSETRRVHPLAPDESPVEGIARERELLAVVKERADKIIDTGAFNVHQLRDVIRVQFSGPVVPGKMNVNLISFGYRYGLPPDADLVMDVRFLPNPYFIDALRPHDGRNDDVRDFVMSKDETKGFIERLEGMLGYLIPLYLREGKSYLTVAIGCTGGRHRSVAIVEALSGDLGGGGVAVRKRHRDLEKV